MINIILCEIIDVAIPLASHTRENTGDTLRGFSRKSYADVYSYNYKNTPFPTMLLYGVYCTMYSVRLRHKNCL